MVKCIVRALSESTDNTASTDGGHKFRARQAGWAHIISPGEGEVELKQRNVVVKVLVVVWVRYRSINGTELV